MLEVRTVVTLREEVGNNDWEGQEEDFGDGNHVIIPFLDLGDG